MTAIRITNWLGRALILFAVVCVLFPELSWAIDCTDDAKFNPPAPSAGSGLVSTIVKNVRDLMDLLAQEMFEAVQSGLADVLRAALTLYIAIYGILFMFGMTNFTLYDFVMRMIKIGVIVLLTTPAAWGYFSSTVVAFFNNGTDDLIAYITSTLVGSVSAPAGAYGPALVLDDVVAKIFSAKMNATLEAVATTSPYGIMLGGMLLGSMLSFGYALLTAIWVYLMSLVVKTLLFGLAPIFLGCLLFDRTRPLFDGWINQLVNASLQPIFLFTFFAFFVKLIEGAIDRMLQIPVCWTEISENIGGTPYNFHYWRFKLDQGGGLQPYNGMWTFFGANQVPYPTSPIFPIDPMGILILLILVELCTQFTKVVLKVASDIAGASVDLVMMGGGMAKHATRGGGGQDSLGGTLGRSRELAAAGRAGGNRGGAPAGNAADSRLRAMQAEADEEGAAEAMSRRMSQLVNPTRSGGGGGEE